MNEFEDTEEYENLEEEFGGPSKKSKRIKLVLKIVGWILFFSVLSVLTYRTCSNSNDPDYISTIMVNKKLADLYSKEGKDIKVEWQKNDIFSRGKENYGYFAATKAITIPEINQMQVVIRYNQSTLEYTKEFLEEKYPSLTPEGEFDRNKNIFDVTLVKVTDLTPEDDEDNNVKEKLKMERFFPTSSTSEERGLHSYRRFVFDEIDCSDALAVYVDIYYNELIDYENDAYATILVHSDEKHNRPYKLSKRDIKALENGFIKED